MVAGFFIYGVLFLSTTENLWGQCIHWFAGRNRLSDTSIDRATTRTSARSGTLDCNAREEEEKEEEEEEKDQEEMLLSSPCTARRHPHRAATSVLDIFEERKKETYCAVEDFSVHHTHSLAQWNASVQSSAHSSRLSQVFAPSSEGETYDFETVAAAAAAAVMAEGGEVVAGYAEYDGGTQKEGAGGADEEVRARASNEHSALISSSQAMYGPI
jgi:hypothetical protein